MGNAAASLPYSIGKQQVASVNHGWALHEGQRKSDKTTVSVFVAKKPALAKTKIDHSASPHLNQLVVATQHYQNAKKLRHPHILKVHATLDTDNPNDTAATGMGSTSAASTTATGDFIIVTEPVIPFTTWIQQSNVDPEHVAWGLECVVRALSFLHTGADMLHGAVMPESLFVTPSGDVKLWNFGIAGSTKPVISNTFVEYEQFVCSNHYRSPERSERRWDALAAAGVHAVDSFSLGVLIPRFFGGRVPQPLVKAVQRLQTPNLRQRPRLQPFLQCPVFDTPYQKWQLQLEEFPVQPVEQKIAFWQNLTPNLQAGVLPESVAVHKILQLIESEVQTICGNETLRAQEMYRKEVLAMITPLFYIAEEFGATSGLGKLTGILFKVNDRAIRGNLLQKSLFLAETLDAGTLNEAVFEPLCSGFSDSSVALRDLTLKSTGHLVTHLTPPNLEKLCRYLVRLQSDPDANIRVEVVTFFGRLAPYLGNVTRQKLLLPALARALKDDTSRIAALETINTVKKDIELGDLATRILPSVTTVLLDPDFQVRQHAFRVVDEILFVLKQESERLRTAAPSVPTAAKNTVPQAPRSAPQPASHAASTPAPAPPASGSGWKISSWMASSTAPDPTPAAPAPQRTAPPPRSVVPPTTAMNGLSVSAPSAKDDSWNDDDDEGGWGDEDLDLSGGGTGGQATRAPVAPAPRAPAPANNNLFAAGDDDDFFGGFEAKSKPATSMRKPTNGGKLVIPKKKDKPAVQKLSVDDTSDGWDDF